MIIKDENNLRLLQGNKHPNRNHREGDLLFQNGDEIVHIEIQNNHHSQMHLRMCQYYTDILFLYEEYKVSQYMVYIGKEKCYMKSQIKRDKMNYSYDIIDIEKIHKGDFTIILVINKKEEIMKNIITEKLEKLKDKLVSFLKETNLNPHLCSTKSVKGIKPK